jgi:hypothetical protein
MSRTALWYDIRHETFLEDEWTLSRSTIFEFLICLQIVAPVILDGSWSCYFWDFEQRKMHVLDPTLMRRNSDRVEQRHSISATKMLDALSRCKECFFQGWDVDMNNWMRCFQVGLGVSCQK